jgi:hypothetical protein
MPAARPQPALENIAALENGIFHTAVAIGQSAGDPEKSC